MSKKIMNYTTVVPVERTISCIEQELVKIGVTHIEKYYEDKVPAGIIFSIMIPNKLSFKIPVNKDSAYEVLRKIPEYKSKPKEWLEAQSNRVAWRIQLNWIEVEVAKMQLNQVDALQVFLGFVYDSKVDKTFYEKIKTSNFKMLTE